MSVNQVLFVNNHGGGFAENRNFTPGETVGDFLARSLPGVNLNDYHIRVNREEIVPASQQLGTGDRVQVVPVAGTRSAESALSTGETVSVTPKKIAGAVLDMYRNVFGVDG